MTKLSLATQTTLDAFRSSSHTRKALVTALQAAVDQVVPETELPKLSEFSEWSLYQWAIERHAHNDSIRRKLLAFADELEDSSQPH
jgi:hypothetical protein